MSPRRKDRAGAARGPAPRRTSPRPRWRFLREISRSSSCRVVLAEDLASPAERCALKIFPVDSERALEAARREFDTVRQLRHPAITEVLELGTLAREDCRLLETICPGFPAASATGEPTRFAFLALRHFEGRDLRATFDELFFTPGGALRTTTKEGLAASWRLFLGAVSQICSALEYIHSRGLIHYDIKPEHILVAPFEHVLETRELRAQLVDFGLSGKETTPVGTRVRGSVPFIAPEIFARSEVDHRSDLFSLGVTLAVTIGGRPPYAGTTPAEWIAAARRGEVVGLDDADIEPRRPAVPVGLSRLIVRLLAPDPEDRPQSAQDVLRELALLEGSASRMAPGSEKLPPSTPTIGFERELNLLRAEFEQVARLDSSVGLALIEIADGQFVSPMLGEVEALARAHGLGYVSVTCTAPSCSPYHPFEEAARLVARRLDLSQPVWEPFLEAVEELAPALSSTTPPKRSSAGVSAPDTGRFVDHLTEFFLEVGRQLPLVLELRDIEHADPESLDLVRSIARNVMLARQDHEDGVAPALDGPLPSRLLLLATFSTGGEEDTHVAGRSARSLLDELRNEPFCLDLRLGGIPLERLAEWISQRAPGALVPGHLLEKLHEKTGGAPRLVDEFLRGYARSLGRSGPWSAHGAESGGLAGGGATGDESAAAEALFQLSPSLGDAIAERAQELPNDSRSLLEALAAAGHFPLPLPAASRLAKRLGLDLSWNDPKHLETHLRELEYEGFVELRQGVAGQEAVWAVGSARELVYQRLDGPRRAKYHQELFEVLRSTGGAGVAVPRPCEVLSYHARRAQLRAEFVEYGLEAADRLDATHAPEAAAHLYEQILEELPALERDGTIAKQDLDATRWRVNSHLAAIAREQGRSSRAVEKLTVLLSLAEENGRVVELAAIYRRLGEVYHEAREHGNAAHFLEKSIATLTRPASASGAESPTERSMELCRVLIALGSFHLERGETGDAAKRLTEALDELAGRGRIVSPVGSRLARSATEVQRSVACRLLAAVHNARNDHARGLSLNLQSLHAAQRSHDLSQISEALTAVGSAYLAQGNHDKALEYYRRAAHLAERRHDKLELARSYGYIATIHHNRGDHSRALEYLDRSSRLNRRIDNTRGIAQNYNNLGNVYRLRDETQKAAESFKKAIDLFARLDDETGMAAGMTNLSGVLEEEGRYSEALEYAFRALDKRKQSKSRAGVAFSHYRIGRIYQAKGEIEKALRYAAKGLRIRRELGEKMATAYSHLQIAELLLSQARFSESLDHCRKGLEEFEEVENQVGELWAKEIEARLLYRLGDIDTVEAILDRIISRAREQEQQGIVGSCLRGFAALAFERGAIHDADQHLREAEALARRLRSQRQIVEVLLQSSSLYLETGQGHRAEGPLEEAYGLIEDLEIRDLAPAYFLNRGRLEAQRARPDREKFSKYFQRGLLEVRESRLPELHWRFHLQIGLAELAHGEHLAARIHLDEAKEIVEDIARSIPQEFRETFYRTRERAALLAAASEAQRAALEPEPTELASRPAGSTRPRSDPAADAALHQRLVKLREVAALIRSETDLRHLLETVMNSVLELLSAERGFIMLKGGQPGDPSVTVARNLDKDEVANPEAKISRSVTSEVFATGKPILVGNALGEARFTDSHSVRDLRLRSVVCVPLRFRSDVLGAIYLDNRYRRDAFTDADLKVLETFADQVSVAVVTARLLDKEKEDQKDTTETPPTALSEPRPLTPAARKNSMRVEGTPRSGHRFANIVGQSEQMQEIFALLEKVSRTLLPVVIQGESGTGKELIARAIHLGSSRQSGRFVSENCGALTETLLETELFGHKRGAFTGAVAEKKGLFELAHDGTLFLDEVGDMSLGMQRKLLRVLEEGEIRPVGSKDVVRVDVRIISASNKDLRELVKEKRFREDLFYRLNAVRIALPPLRERKDDIQPLVEHFLEELRAHGDGRPWSFTPAALRAMEAYHWPGNVRELRHFVEKTVLFAARDTIDVADLGFDAPGFPHRGVPPASRDTVTGGRGDPRTVDFREARLQFERGYVRSVLDLADGNVSEAARRAGLSRESFYRLLRKHGLRPRGRSR